MFDVASDYLFCLLKDAKNWDRVSVDRDWARDVAPWEKDAEEQARDVEKWAREAEERRRLGLLLHFLEVYVNGAIIEMRRLERARRRWGSGEKVGAGRRVRKNFDPTYCWVDTHFYFICVDKVYKLLGKLGEELDDDEIRTLEGRVEDIFNVSKVRNHLEHFDARLQGFIDNKAEDNAKKERKKPDADVDQWRDKFELGNFWGDNFSIGGDELGGDQFPCGKSSLDALKKIYTDLIDILRERYASKDKDFVYWQQEQERTKALMQWLKKAGLL